MFTKAVIFHLCTLLITLHCSLGIGVQAAYQNGIHRPHERNYGSTLPHLKSSLIRRRRQLRPAEFTVNGKTFKFDLTSSKRRVENHNTLVYTVESTPYRTPNHTYTRVNLPKNNNVVLQDVKKRATFTTSHNGTHIIYDGVFSEGKTNYPIQGVPEKLHTPVYHQNTEFSDDRTNIICESTKLRQNQTEEITDEDYMELENPLRHLFPELLVIVDYQLFKKFDENVAETVKYVYNMWNAVDLMFARFEEPTVQILLKGVIIAKDERALNYIYESRNKTDMSKISTVGILENMREYFYTDFPKADMGLKYDSVFVMTGLRAGTVKGAGMIGLICNNRNNIGSAEDNGAYGGLQYITHELGHMLGLPHDLLVTEDNRCEDFPKIPTDILGCVMQPSAANGHTDIVWSQRSRALLIYHARIKKLSCLVHPSCPIDL